jgi:hypothetical protein
MGWVKRLWRKWTGIDAAEDQAVQAAGMLKDATEKLRRMSEISVARDLELGRARDAILELRCQVDTARAERDKYRARCNKLECDLKNATKPRPRWRSAT